MLKHWYLIPFFHYIFFSCFECSFKVSLSFISTIVVGSLHLYLIAPVPSISPPNSHPLQYLQSTALSLHSVAKCTPMIEGQPHSCSIDIILDSLAAPMQVNSIKPGNIASHWTRTFYDNNFNVLWHGYIQNHILLSQAIPCHSSEARMPKGLPPVCKPFTYLGLC